MSRKYDFGIVVGRFQPFHNAHQELIKDALNFADKVVIIFGSARSAPDVRNPFTPAMREEMISNCFPDDASRLVFRQVRDYPYNDNFWVAEVQNIVAQVVADNFVTADEISESVNAAKIALIGHFKDRTSYYLNLFPQWGFEDFYRSSSKLNHLNAKDIRQKFFLDDETWRESLPKAIVEYLETFKTNDYFAVIQREFQYLQKYRADTKFVNAPYDAVFITTDVVVVQSGHVLVIRRGHQPGKGLLALPGGFLQTGATLEDSAVRELKEETSINISVSVLKGSVKNSRVFDYPERSQRGRTITFAYLIELQASLEKGLPSVKGGDDAAKAFWLPLSALGEMEEQFFEDHLHIIRYFLGIQS